MAMSSSRWDKDGDGFVTLEEIKAFFASGRQQQRGPAQNPAALQAGGVPMKTVPRPALREDSKAWSRS